MRAVDHCGLQLQLAGGAQLIEQHLMQLRPDPGLRPVSQASPAGDAGAVELLSGHLSPGAAGDQDMDDAGRRGTLITRQPPGMAEPAGRTRREQRLQPLPQPVRHQLRDPLQHHVLSHAPKTATPSEASKVRVKSVVCRSTMRSIRTVTLDGVNSGAWREVPNR